MAAMIIRLGILLLAAVYIYGLFETGALVWPRTRIDVAVAVFLGLAILSVARSPYAHQSLQWLGGLLGYALLLYVLVGLLKEWDDMEKLLAAVVCAGMFEATFALVQAWGREAERPSGTFFNPNFLAGYLTVSWSILLGLWCYHVRFPYTVKEWRRLFAGTGARATLFGLVLLLPILLTGSRGGMMALIVGTTVVLGLRFGRRAVGALALLCMLAVMISNPFRERLIAEHTVNPVGYARLGIWSAGIQAMTEYPLGIGLGLYQYLAPRYAVRLEGQIAEYGKIAQTAHNEYLQIGIELGAGALCVFLWGVIGVVREAREVLRSRLRRRSRGLLAGILGAMGASLAHAAVDSNLHEPAIAMALTLLTAVVLAARRLSGGAPRLWSLGPIRSRLAGLCVLAALAVVMEVGIIKTGAAWIVYDLGSRQINQQDFTGAAEHFHTAVRLDPGKALYHSSLAASYFHMFKRAHLEADAQRAVDESEAARRLNPLDGRISGLIGQVYVARAAGASAPDQRRSWLRLAQAAYQQAVKLEPVNPFHRLSLAVVQEALGEGDDAESSVRRAIEIEPNFLPGREWLTRRYIGAKRMADAEREYREILDRRRRYAGVKTDPYEERFLMVDAEALARTLRQARGRS